MTIDCVNVATAHLFGDALAAQHRLRHRIFVQRKHWQIPVWDGMEFDQFDTPAANYFIWRDQGGEARGIARFTPTQLPYMLQTLWPEMVESEPLPSDPRVWEGSRIGIEHGLNPVLRRRILGELFCAYLEIGYPLRSRSDNILGCPRKQPIPLVGSTTHARSVNSMSGSLPRPPVRTIFCVFVGRMVSGVRPARRRWRGRRPGASFDAVDAIAKHRRLRGRFSRGRGSRCGSGSRRCGT